MDAGQQLGECHAKVWICRSDGCDDECSWSSLAQCNISSQTMLRATLGTVRVIRMKILFPDACWSPDMISGALFLYFNDEQLTFTLHPSVSTHLTGADPFDFLEFLENARPDWLPKFSRFIETWQIYRSSIHATSQILKPLLGGGFKTFLMAYPKDVAAWERSEDLIASSELSFSKISKIIDPFSASDELFAHIFFEKFLELYEGHRTAGELTEIGKEAAIKGIHKRAQVDWRALYEYCDTLFRPAELDQLLTTAYMFRLPILQVLPSVLLTNPRMIDFLASLPVDAKRKEDRESMEVELDVVAWEFFRQLVSPVLDPLDKAAVDKTCRIIQHHPDEIDALKRRCVSLAHELGAEADLEVLQNRISQHIRGEVEGEVQAVLSLDKQAVTDLLDKVFSDKQTWIGIATFLYSLTTGGAVVTAGAAIYALSTVGSKAVRVAFDRRQRLQMNDYALLYRMR